MVRLVLFFMFAASVPVAASDPMPITLDQAFASALKHSEDIAQRGETYEQVSAQIDQLWSAVKPRVQLTGSHFWQDTPGAGVNFPLPANQDTVSINGHQAIFGGLRDFLAVNAAKSLSESSRLAIARAKQLLYQDVAKAYLDLLRSRRAIGIHEEQFKLTQARVKELENFAEIGRSRHSEVLAVKSQHAQDEADLAAAHGEEHIRQATLRFLTGIDQDLSPVDVDEPALPGPVEDFNARAKLRPDVEGAQKDLSYSDTFVTIQQRLYWPTVGLDGSYYLRRPQNFSKNVHWDATLSAVLPLYSGGQIAGQIREAKAQRGYREQAFSLAARKALLEVRQAYDDLASDLAVVKALRNALTLAESNATAQSADYRHGLVTNIDVLTSLTTVQNTKLRLDQAQLQAYDDYVRLEVASGGPGSLK